MSIVDDGSVPPTDEQLLALGRSQYMRWSKVNSSTDRYIDEEIAYHLRRISSNLLHEGYTSDARRLMNILASLRARFDLVDPYMDVSQ